MTRDAVKVRSKLLFGNAHLLEVAALIAQMPADVRPLEVQREVDLVPSTVHRSLKRLLSADLLVQLDREPGEREQRYARVEHPFWDAALTLRDSALGGR